MAALTTQPVGTSFTMVSATGGGDTVEASAIAGGWNQGVYLVVTAGATPTTVTIDGVAQTSLTSQTSIYLVPAGVKGSRKNITYNQVSSVVVGAFQGSLTNHYASFGT